MYIYIYAVELKTGPRFGVSSVKNWSKSSVKTGPSFFLFTVLPHFYSVFFVFLKTQIVSHCAKIVFLQNFGDVKNEVFEKKLHFLFVFFYVREIGTEKEKKKMERPKIPVKNRFFSRWSCKNVKNQKNGFFAKIA